MSQFEINIDDVIARIDGIGAWKGTAYQVWKVLSEIIKDNGRQDELKMAGRPQMMYNYLANGIVVPKQKLTGPTLRNVTVDEAAEFITRYCTKHELSVVQGSDPNQLELELEI
jgi:hypothetical protein